MTNRVIKSRFDLAELGWGTQPERANQAKQSHRWQFLLVDDRQVVAGSCLIRRPVSRRLVVRLLSGGVTGGLRP